MNQLKQLTVTLAVEPALAEPAARLQELLGFKLGNGITVKAEQGTRNGAVLKDGVGTIYYTKKHMFFRELGILLQHARTSESFEVFEEAYFETLSLMLDVSRAAVPTLKTVYRLLDVLAVCGYNMVMLYTEDVFYIEGRPRFGYMRGRYTPEQLRAFDDYADSLGIEAIPCIECYSHMGKYLMWSEASAIKDTSTVLLAREEKTFEFVEQLIDSITACFRSKRIHIGMDEAWDMGRGKFLNKHGRVPISVIFYEYIDRLMQICRARGLRPMMWSDTYYDASGASYGARPEKCTLSQEAIDALPRDIDLVYWHYGERQRDCDEPLLRSHQATGNPVIYAGAVWSWSGLFPEHFYTMETLTKGLAACRATNVREAMLTVWTCNYGAADWFSNLMAFSFFAETAFDPNADKEKLRARFAATTGGDWDAFLDLSYYYDDFADPHRCDESFRERFMGDPMLWQDVLEGNFDAHLQTRPMSAHYATYAKKMQAHADARPFDQWQYLYAFAAKLFDMLSTKTYIAERLQPAYQQGDKALLQEIAETHLPLLTKKMNEVRATHKKIWLSHNKDVGFSYLDRHYAGAVGRTETAAELLRAYLAGEREEIESLAEVREKKSLAGFYQYVDLATVFGYDA